jgi:hypothetical protein
MSRYTRTVHVFEEIRNHEAFDMPAEAKDYEKVKIVSKRN